MRCRRTYVLKSYVLKTYVLKSYVLKTYVLKNIKNCVIKSYNYGILSDQKYMRLFGKKT